MYQENFPGIENPYIAKQGDVVRIEIWIPEDTKKIFRAEVKTSTDEGKIAIVQAIEDSSIYVKNSQGQFVLNESTEDNTSITKDDILAVEEIDLAGQATAYLEKTASTFK